MYILIEMPSLVELVKILYGGIPLYLMQAETVSNYKNLIKRFSYIERVATAAMFQGWSGVRTAHAEHKNL